MRLFSVQIVYLLQLLLPPSVLHAETGCRAESIRICSQNLQRYSDPTQRDAEERRRKQLDYLLARMRHARCDVIALQEVYGTRTREAERTVRELAGALSLATGRRFRGTVAESEDPAIRNGFLIAEDSVEVLEERSFLDEPLPRLQGRGPIKRFLRAPALVRVRSRRGHGATVAVLNVHFKSKSSGFKDRTRTGFETLRMEMAEATRRLVLREQERMKGAVFVVLGDRNADDGSGTALLLSGERGLEDFQNGTCRLQGEAFLPECTASSPERHAPLVPLFAARRLRFPGEYRGGSYRYQGKQELLDEILVPVSDLPRVTTPNGRFAIGFEGEFFKGSDHKMVWTEVCLAP